MDSIWKLMLLAGAGGFVGTSCRFLINKLFLIIWKAPFPLATFTINVLGCFIFGILFGLLGRSGAVPPKLNALLVVGFCGGFTTFSTFSFESFNLGTSGEIFSSFLYIAGSVIVGLLAVWFGLLISR